MKVKFNDDQDEGDQVNQIEEFGPNMNGLDFSAGYPRSVEGANNLHHYPEIQSL